MTDPNRQRWTPSNRQMELEWVLRQIMRFVVGPGVIVWELVVGRGQNLAVLLVGAMLSSSTDVLSLVRGLIRQARDEQKQLKDIIRDEVENEKGDSLQ